MKKICALTLGCKVNQYETEAMIEAFEQSGYEIVDAEDVADIYIINTCSVTNMGDRKSRQMIRKPLEKNPEALIVVTGCYAQLAPEKVRDIPGVKLVIGTSERKDIVSLVERALQSEDKIVNVKNIMEVKEFEELSIEGYKSHTRAFIKIQEGCDNYCTYCIIPYARGHIRSRKAESVIVEIKRLAQAGFKEVVLTGIHIGSYGKDLGTTSLIEIIEDIHKIDGIERIRFGSIEPNTLSHDFLKRIEALPKVCHHFHLSLQSGCDTVLKRMNRKYNVKDYQEAVEKLREIYPDVALTTDIIVGFPGETEEEFEITKEFVKKIFFSEIHIFKYSPREGTPAAGYKNQIPSKVKDERSKALSQTASEMSEAYKKSFMGETRTVLFEQSFHEKNICEGLTGNYLKVAVESPEDLKGKLLEVTFTKTEKDYIFGIIKK